MGVVRPPRVTGCWHPGRVGSRVAAVVVAVFVAGCGGGSSSGALRSPARPAGSAATTAVVPPAPAGSSSVPAPPPVTGPASVAGRLVAVETAIRDRSTPDADLAGLGREQQDLYRLLVRNPDWQATVQGLLPADLRALAGAHVMAGTELRRLAQPKPELPKWRIVAPGPAGELLAEYKGAQSALGVPWQYLAAIHLVETRMGRIRGDSVAGAQGPMQFIPSTWKVYGNGGDINSDHDSILAAARLLKSRGAPADMARALYAYNPSQRYVRAVTAYAGVMAAEERAYLAYHGWQVYYGDTLLPEGYVG